ncbi:MAG: exodeoxyribonuclease VII small subunit [Candidatus Rokubacteria bacterium]|nr:exodeoxyribonuclease VII small subunit [Candidatus Rokubacteria bacterium]
MPEPGGAPEPDFPKFEEALARLEQLVATLEAGTLSLDESLKAFEEGIALVRYCGQCLEAVERRIEVLTRDESDLLRPQPFGWEEEREA